MTEILLILNKRKLFLYENNRIVRSFSVAIGKAGTPTPTGTFTIINKIKNPYNPVLGSRWMQFTPQMHGIHGTNQPWLIGQAVSNGCVRMYNQDAEFLFSRISTGTTLKINNNNSSETNYNNFIYYIIKRGDTLYKIAKKYNVSVKDIIKVNNIKDSHRIHPGQKIKIPN